MLTAPDTAARFSQEFRVLLGLLSFTLQMGICWLLARRCVKREPFFWKDE